MQAYQRKIKATHLGQVLQEPGAVPLKVDLAGTSSVASVGVQRTVKVGQRLGVCS